MRDTKSLKSDLEAEQAKHMKEAEHISKLLSAITEAEQYLGKDDTQRKLSLPNTKNRRRSPKKTGRERIREALQKMPETFTSKDLWNAANEDGQGKEVKASTFRPYMSKLIRTAIVTPVQKSKGTTPGTYKRGINAG